MKKQIKLYSLHIPVLIVVGLLVIGAYMALYDLPSVKRTEEGYSVNSGNGLVVNSGDTKDIASVLGKSDNSGKGNSNKKDDRSAGKDKSSDKSSKSNSGNTEKNTDSGSSKSNNANEYKQNVQKATKTLTETITSDIELDGIDDNGTGDIDNTDLDESTDYENKNSNGRGRPKDNPKTQEILDVIEEVEEDSDVVADAIEAVEAKSTWSTLLFGSDYKNLGQLRSSLAKNTNNIRKLNKFGDEEYIDDESGIVTSQLELLEQERQRIVSVIQENESRFSLLGWVSKLLTGYDDSPIGGGDDTPESTESTQSTSSI